ncbi:unnamed protein product [Eruca vesicaria subsp. sativa]|uniref:Myb/SANT-like domain-containing protein n=1 Tax=Eruca vesicaria subsp. sativa TaxID=29727 RepID=A0ABC8JFQ1_ERUVS|nr:unnamed protein product [Eruca vesicaria subsp. sativa]
MGLNLILVMILLGQIHGCKSCIQKERLALFELKKYMISVAPEEESTFVNPTWTNDTKSDCCLWEDVKCNRSSGRVNEISFGFKSLRRLRKLEILAFTANDFNNSIFPFINAATSLTKLYFLDCNMDGHVPVKELRDLTNLELLDMSWNRLNDSIPIQESSPLKNLKALSLRGNNFFSSMGLQGKFAQIISWICKLKNLQELDLKENKLVGHFPLCLTSLTGLQVLDLSSNQMTGTIPSSLGNLRSLEYLSLFDNNFEGIFSLGSLTNLSELRVLKSSSKSNTFKVVIEKSWKPKFQLSVIALQSCNLEYVPRFLLYQKGLRHVDLSDNKIAENFPSWLVANNSKLEFLLLQNNFFVSFQLPESAHNLLFLDLSMNEFSDEFPQNIGWILPHLQYMNLAKNNFQGNLPASLGNMKSIEHLDMSHNSFHGKLPISFLKGCYSLLILKLSHNKLSGEVFREPANFTDITVLAMDNNSFTGKIRQGLRSLKYLNILDISNNNLKGVIPSWIGEFSNLNALLLSNNSLEGEIPMSLFNMSYLGLLDLSANMLSGDIPPHVNSETPIVLLLQDNNFSKGIPDTLLLNVSILDLRNNRLSGNIPDFINSQNINILLLRGNNFTGHIPHRLCGLSNIHLLDLANNGLSGSIPSCLSNISFNSGKEHTSSNYYDFSYGYDDSGSGITPSRVDRENNIGLYFISLVVIEERTIAHSAGVQTKIEFPTKHRYDAYMGGNLLQLCGLDLSQNELSGEIPIELGGLLELHALNLSRNYLSGVIPTSFSGLKNVESLDLSFNRLHGKIPPQLTELSILAVFNVSYNNLPGVIPQGKQFNTFDAKSYLGNSLLCGQPTNKSCNSNNIREEDNEVEDDDEYTIDMVSFYWSLTAAYVTILVGILASLSFDSPWSRAWFNFVDAFLRKIAMGDKEKNQYSLWNSEETKVLIELLVDGIQRGWRDSNGIMNKATVEHKILPVLNGRLGCQKTHKHYLSRIKFLKGQYQCYVDLLNNSSGFGWDPIMKRFMASNEVWNDYLKGHPNQKFLRYDFSEQFDDLKIIFDCATANGSSAIGLGDTTDARVFTVGDSQVQENLNFEDINDDVYAQQPSPENGVKRRVEKLVSRKRSRTDTSGSSVEINSDQSDAMVMMTSKILTFITQREERHQKEAEKREAEKKKNSVWDGMKEVPNLDDHIKFKAVTLIYSLGMKDVFTDMSIEKRYGWIQSNVN